MHHSQLGSPSEGGCRKSVFPLLFCPLFTLPFGSRTYGVDVTVPSTVLCLYESKFSRQDCITVVSCSLSSCRRLQAAFTKLNPSCNCLFRCSRSAILRCNNSLLKLWKLNVSFDWSISSEWRCCTRICVDLSSSISFWSLLILASASLKLHTSVLLTATGKSGWLAGRENNFLNSLSESSEQGSKEHTVFLSKNVFLLSRSRSFCALLFVFVGKSDPLKSLNFDVSNPCVLLVLDGISITTRCWCNLLFNIQYGLKFPP